MRRLRTLTLRDMYIRPYILSFPDYASLSSVYARLDVEWYLHGVDVLDTDVSELASRDGINGSRQNDISLDISCRNVSIRPK